MPYPRCAFENQLVVFADDAGVQQPADGAIAASTPLGHDGLQVNVSDIASQPAQRVATRAGAAAIPVLPQKKNTNVHVRWSCWSTLTRSGLNAGTNRC